MEFNENMLERPQSEDALQISQKSAVARYLRYWYLFALGLVLAIGAAFIYIRYATPLYSINSLVLIKDRRDNEPQSRMEQFNYANNLNEAKNIDNEIIMLKSVSLMHRVLAELALNTSYYIKGQMHDLEVYQGALPFKLIITKLDSTAYGKSIIIVPKNENEFVLEEAGQVASAHQFGQLITKPYGLFTVVSTPSSLAFKNNKSFIIKFQNLQKVVNDYNKKLSVTAVNKQASILSLTLTDAVPKKGQVVLNKLIEVYNKEGIEDKNSIAQNTIEFIDERLKYLGTELSNVEKGVESFKRKNEVADVSSQINQSLADVSDYNKQAISYGVQLDVLESISQYINTSGNQQQLIPSTLSAQDPTLSGLIIKFNELQLDRERMLRTAQADNPVVVSINEQLNNLRSSILKNIEILRDNLTTIRRNLQAKSGQSGLRIQRVPTIERGLQEINRQQELKRSLYLYLLQKREEAALSLAATVSNAHVIDSATVGEYPVSPQKPAALALALMFGLGLPFAFIYIKGLLDNKVQSMQEVSWATKALVLGELLHNKSRDNIVISADSRTPISEMLRLIRTNFHFATDGHANKVILITSSMSGEGKTFFSLNLGASLVLAGKSVVLISLDLRKRDVTGEIVAPNELGITEYLRTDKVSVDDIVYPSTDIPGLHRISTGMLPDNPAEVLMSPKMAKVLDVLKQSFDHIILDSSPIGQVADAFALASLVDYTIYVVRYNFTYKAQLEIVNSIQADKKLLPIGLVLNDVKKNNLPDYGYGTQEEKVRKKTV